MIRSIIKKGKQYLKLAKHRRDWRKSNSHNFTIASTFFPLNKVKAGKYSYGDLHIISYGEDNEGLEIGNFVSIANDVKFLLGGNHYYKRFTTYPFVAKLQDPAYIETWSKGKIVVEDDVWIGTEAFVMSGVKIGKGAIVAARTVVSKDVPAYAIVAGNPAKIVKYRFDEATIQKLKSIDFSNLNHELVLKNLAEYRSEHEFEGMLNLLNSDKS